jgi:two-component system OmpR family sensor kinase
VRGTLRARLVVTMLLLLAVAGAGIGLVTTLALREFLVDRLDEDLMTTGQIVRRLPPPDEPAALPPQGESPPDDDVPFGPGLPFGILSAVVVDGSVVGAGTIDRDGVRRSVPAGATAAIAGIVPGEPPRSVDLAGLGSYRMVAVLREDGVTLVTGLPEERVEDTVARLVGIEALAVVLMLVGAGVVGAVAVRRELRPLERVAATASRVSALPLDRGEVELVERVDVADPRSEVGQVGAALNRMLDHVGSALESRQDSETQLRQFVADASHELRTPLAAIRGYAELTRRPDADTGYALTRISAQAERMTTLVEDLLLLARLDAGRPLERAEVDLTHLVLDAVGDAHAAGPEHRWRLDLPDEPVTVTGDASRLAQVLANLLANARTHTPEGTAVTVRVDTTPDAAIIQVVDAGPGIPPDLRPHIFERFARGDSSRSRAAGSTGLGLSIVHAVVTAHGGTVSVQSEPGQTVFTVALPTTGRPVVSATGQLARSTTPG